MASQATGERISPHTPRLPVNPGRGPVAVRMASNKAPGRLKRPDTSQRYAEIEAPAEAGRESRGVGWRRHPRSKRNASNRYM